MQQKTANCNASSRIRSARLETLVWSGPVWSGLTTFLGVIGDVGLVGMVRGGWGVQAFGVVGWSTVVLL